MKNKQIQLVPTMNSTMSENAAWCASFDLVWKEFINKYLQDSFSCDNSNKTISNLNKEAKKEFNLDNKDYYVNSGLATIKLKKEIEKALKYKFATTSDILDQFEFSKDDKTDKLFLYAIIMFTIKFKYQFHEANDLMPFKKGKAMAKYFTSNDLDTNVNNQLKPLFYKDDNDFALSINTDDNKEIILYRTDKNDSFENIYNDCLNNSDTNKQKIKVLSFATPNIDIDLFKEFKELQGTSFIRNSDNLGFIIDKAVQTLKFKLNNKGASVKSEAGMGVRCFAFNDFNTVSKEFIFNDTFYLYIRESKTKTPIIALRVNDIDLFQ